MSETSNFKVDPFPTESGRYKWTLTLTDWMAHYFQEYVFPINQIDYLAGRIEKTADGRTLYEIELDEETTQHFRAVLIQAHLKPQLN